MTELADLLIRQCHMTRRYLRTPIHDDVLQNAEIEAYYAQWLIDFLGDEITDELYWEIVRRAKKSFGREVHRDVRACLSHPTMKCETGIVRGICEDKLTHNRARRLKREIETLNFPKVSCSVKGCQRDASHGYNDPDWGRVCHSHGMTLRKRRKQGTDTRRPLNPLTPKVTGGSKETHNRDVWLAIHKSLTKEEWDYMWNWACHPAGKWRPCQSFRKARLALLEKLKDGSPQYEEIHKWICSRGYARYAVSSGGSSHYYVSTSGSGLRIRLSDHDSNQKETLERITEKTMLDVRISNPKLRDEIIEWEDRMEPICEPEVYTTEPYHKERI